MPGLDDQVVSTLSLTTGPSISVMGPVITGGEL